jgi:hypothetical protein
VHDLGQDLVASCCEHGNEHLVLNRGCVLVTRWATISFSRWNMLHVIIYEITITFLLFCVQNYLSLSGVYVSSRSRVAQSV